MEETLEEECLRAEVIGAVVPAREFFRRHHPGLGQLRSQVLAGKSIFLISHANIVVIGLHIHIQYNGHFFITSKRSVSIMSS